MSEQPKIRRYDCYDHQLRVYDFCLDRPAAMAAIHMGGGKSKVAIDLLQNRGDKRCLILCPASVMPVWRREFARHGVGLREPLVLDGHGTSDRKLKQIEQYVAASSDGQSYIVVNYETARSGQLGKRLAATAWDCVILDESHRCKDPMGVTSKWCASLKATHRLCLTGTPMPHSPLDIYAQFRFLDRSVLGTSYVAFRARYAQTHPKFPSKVFKYVNQDELANKMALLCIQVSQDELDFSLPPITHHQRRVELSDRARKFYAQLRDEMIASIGDIEVVTANQLSLLVRLQQAVSGFAGEPDGNVVAIDNGRINALSDLLDDLPHGEPVVVFCRFLADIDAVRNMAERRGLRSGEISGRYKDLTSHGTMPEDVDVLAVQWQAGGVGIDLTRARVAVGYSGTWNMGDFDQAIARLHRNGQQRHVDFFHLECENTIDTVIRKVRDARRAVVGDVMDRADLARQIMEGIIDEQRVDEAVRRPHAAKA